MHHIHLPLCDAKNFWITLQNYSDFALGCRPQYMQQLPLLIYFYVHGKILQVPQITFISWVL